MNYGDPTNPDSGRADYPDHGGEPTPRPAPPLRPAAGPVGRASVGRASIPAPGADRPSGRASVTPPGGMPLDGISLGGVGTGPDGGTRGSAGVARVPAPGGGDGSEATGPVTGRASVGRATVGRASVGGPDS